MRTWGRCLGEPLPVPQLDGSTDSPLLPSHTRPGVPSPSASLTGLPDEAFESLTQLQHIYVAHNRVSPPPLTQGLAFQGSSQAWVTWPSMGQHGIGGWNGTT